MKAIATEIQKAAKQLRREGKSHREIAKILTIGLGTAFYYSRGIRLTDKQHRSLVAQSYEKGFGKLTKEDRRLASVKGGINNRKNLKPKYSRNHLIALLKDFYAQYKRIPTKRDFMSMYGSFFRNFGTWNNAIRKAGFSPNPVLFAKKYVANDGHKCDSLAEKIIDDWLTAKKISHKRSVPYLRTHFTADFKIGDTLIEFFGLHGQLRRYDLLMKPPRPPLRSRRGIFLSRGFMPPKHTPLRSSSYGGVLPAPFIPTASGGVFRRRGIN